MFRYFIVLFLILITNFSFGQVVLTQDETNASIGLDRKAWNGLGNTSLHSDGYAHDFTLPARTNPCEQITGIRVEISLTNYTYNGPCPHFETYYNLFYGCNPYTGGATCLETNVIAQSPFAPNTSPPAFNFVGPFDFGENLSVDIIPVSNAGCNAVVNGDISHEYTITVTVTVTENTALTPDFTAVPAICEGDALTALPTTSNNGITGTWMPALDNTATTTYTFTPAITECAVATDLTITVNQAPPQPTVACYETATFNAALCSWEVSGTQPVEPTTALECWETRSFNDTTCAWEVSGTQPIEPTTALECWETRSFNTTTCAWEVSGTQPVEPTTALECWETRSFNTTTCSWEVSGTQPIEPTTALECWETRSFNTTTCAWEVSGTQPIEPTTALECWETRSFNTTTCSWEVSGTQPVEPTTTLECWETRSFNTTTCSWEVSGTQPVEPTTALECWETRSFNTTTCSWEVSGTQPIEPTTALECWETRSFNTTTCSWEVSGTQPIEPTTALECWETRSFNTTTCAWEVSGTQPVEPTAVNCWDDYQFEISSCTWVNNGTAPLPNETTVNICEGDSYTWPANGVSYTTEQLGLTIPGVGCSGDEILNLTITNQPVEPTIACYETAVFNPSICAWEVSGTQPLEPTTALECWETRSFNTTTCSWEVSGTQPVEPTTTLECWETRNFNTTTCAWEVNGTQPVEPTAVNCWDDYQFEISSCTWVNNGTAPLPNETTVNICEGDSYTWPANGVSYTTEQLGLTILGVGCSGDEILNLTITNQPVEPTIACYETATFNPSICSWEITGTQPAQPPVVNCWDMFVFNTALCDWENTGTAPVPNETTVNICEGDSYTWPANNVTYTTEQLGLTISGVGCTGDETLNLTLTDQPIQPTLACYETATFNASTCSWEVTGTPPAEPPVVNCWDTFVFNTATCVWDNTGIAPVPNETNVNICEGDSYTWPANGVSYTTEQLGLTIPGIGCTGDEVLNLTLTDQPDQPTLACYETATFNASTCSWEVTGTPPAEPPLVNCWDMFVFNTALCDWENTGIAPVPNETNVNICEGDSYTWPANNVTYTTEQLGLTIPGIGCTGDEVLNLTLTDQPDQPTLACYETATFNPSICSWEITGTQPAQPPVVNCWDMFVFNTALCDWENTGTAPVPNETNVNICEGDSYTWPANNVTYTTEQLGLTIAGIGCTGDEVLNLTLTNQPIQPTLACYETATFNASTCSWEVTGTSPAEPPVVNCWDTFVFNTATCDWDNTGAQPAQPLVVNCWDTFVFNATTCVWDNTGTQPEVPTGLECWETATFNDATCMWDITGTPTLEFRDEFLFLCEDETLLLEAISFIDNPTSYIWDSGQATPSIIIDTPGIFEVEVTDGCSTEIIMFNVDLVETPLIESIFSEGSSIIINVSGNGNYLYSLNGFDYQSINVFNNVPSDIYTVYIKSIECDIVVTMEYLHFFIPNFITPNGDGVNDFFLLNLLQYSATSEVYIFDRYGKLLFSAINSNIRWDGTFNGKKLPTSDYWYRIVMDGKSYKGHFTLKN